MLTDSFLILSLPWRGGPTSTLWTLWSEAGHAAAPPQRGSGHTLTFTPSLPVGEPKPANSSAVPLCVCPPSVCVHLLHCFWELWFIGPVAGPGFPTMAHGSGPLAGSWSAARAPVGRLRPALAVCRWTPLPPQRRFSLWMDAHLAVRGQNRGTAAAMMLMSPPSLLLNVET